MILGGLLMWNFRGKAVHWEPRRPISCLLLLLLLVLRNPTDIVKAIHCSGF
jgi:hypothetical protein